MIYTNPIDAIGNTPLVNLDICPMGTLLAKLEYLNPGGSVKDRSARYLIGQAEKSGLLQKGWTIIDASSGNQGIATAMIGALKGYPVIISVSEKISTEKYLTLKMYGAEVVVCKPTNYMDDPESYHSIATKIHAAIANSYMPNQYYNVQNTQAHYLSLGPEIWEQTQGKITHFFAGAGTGGTISGVGRYLKEQNSNIKIIAIDSEHSFRSTQGNPKPYAIEGLGVDFVSPVLDYSVINEIITVRDDQAFTMMNKLANKAGFLVGPSSGAVAHVAQEYAKKYFNADDCGVIIFGDSGRAYLSKLPSTQQHHKIYADEFINQLTQNNV